MNKTISSRLAILLILLVSFAVGLFLWQDNKKFGQPDQLIVPYLKKKSCPHVFQGKAEIQVWQAMENSVPVLKIADEDANIVPKKNCAYFELIDSDPDLEVKLAKSSQKNPVLIKITGFAQRCSGIPLASINYKDGIFRPFL